jgi:hypothetical protein
MNNSNSRPFTQRGRALLNELKEFTVQINSSVANKPGQLTQIIMDLKSIENKIETIKNDFLTKRNNILGQEFANAPTPFPTIMKMDAFLYDLKDQKNKENARRKQEANKLAENQRLLTEATGKNIEEKSQIIRNTINKLRRNIGNTNNSSNNNYKPPNIFNNTRSRSNNSTLVSHPLTNVVNNPQRLASNVVNQRIKGLVNKINTSNNKTSLNRLRLSINSLPNSNTKANALARINNKISKLNAGL